MIKRQNLFHIGPPFLLLASLLFILSGCDPDKGDETSPGTVRMELSLNWNGEDFSLGDVQTDHAGHPIRIDNLQMYISPIEMRNSLGEWEEIIDVALLDFGAQGQKFAASAFAGTYSAIRFGMGLPSEINTDIDPASYANDHPLSVPGSAGMFWTWSSGYVFVKYEGKFSLEAGEQLVEPLSYHCGTDESYRTVSFELENTLLVESDEITDFSLDFNAAAALIGADDAIDIVEDPVTHNSDGTILGGRLMDLMDDAWTLNP
tara:strand:+ start:345 stop:1127 length:783 start_codon:yes stop_codon:yes gene_type:complete